MEEKENWYDPISDDEFDAGRVSRLSDRPNQPSAYGAGGLSAKDLKAWFDKSATLLKDKLNELLRSIKEGKMSDELEIPLGDITSLSELCEAVTSGDLANIFSVPGETTGELVTLAATLARIYELLSENQKSVQAANQTLKEKVGFTDYATATNAGVVKVFQGSSTSIGITTNGLINVLKATKMHIATRGKNLTDYVLTASKTNDIVEAALTDENKMVLSDYGKATARETLGAASTEDVDGMHLALSMDEAFNLKVSLLNANNEEIDSQSIDLPLEEMIVSGKVSDDGEKIILTLKNSETIEFAVSALVGGLAKQETLNTVIEDVEALKKKKIELAPTLGGNDTDKAPSVKAVNEGLALANSFRNIVRGEAVKLEGVSAFQHEVLVKLSSDDVTDFSSTRLFRYGKNFVDNTNYIVTSSGAATFNDGEITLTRATEEGNPPSIIFYLGDYEDFIGKTVTLSAELVGFVNNTSANIQLMAGDVTKTSVKTLASLSVSTSNIGKKLSNSVTITKLDGFEGRPLTIRYYLSGGKTVGDAFTTKNLQVEIGATATEYEEYKPSVEYTPNSDGTVNGIALLHPTTTFMTATQGVVIEAEYNKSVKAELDGKIDKTTKGSVLYGTNEAGDGITLTYGNSVLGNAIVRRAASGNINVPLTPASDGTATSKKYVDDNLAPIKDAVTVVNRDVDTLKRIAVGSLCTTLVDVGPYSWGVGKNVPENALDIALVNRLGAQFDYEGYEKNLFKNASVKKAHNVFYWSLWTDGSLFNFTMENDTDENGILRPPGAYVYFDPFTIPAGGGYYRIKIKPYTEEGVDTGSVEGSYCVRLCHVEKTENPYPAEEGLTRDNIIWYADGIGSEGCETKDEYGSDWVFLQPYDGKDWEVNCLVFESSIDAPSCSFDLYKFEVTIEKPAERIASYPVPKIISTTSIYEELDTVDEITIPDAIQALEGYGLMYSEEKYNYLDFDNRSFVRVCKKDTNGDVVLLDTPEIVDVSADLPEDAGMISVVPRGHIATQRALDLAAGYEKEGFEPLVCDMTYLVKL